MISSVHFINNQLRNEWEKQGYACLSTNTCADFATFICVFLHCIFVFCSLLNLKLTTGFARGGHQVERTFN